MIQDEASTTEIVQWHNEKYAIGIEELDNQHKTIFSKMNHIADAIKRQQSQQVIFKLFDDLRCYFDFHSQTELKYIHKLSESDKLLHQLQHKLISQQMDELKANYQMNNLSDTEILQCLADWFVDHILHEDSKFKSLVIN